ncbi:MerR family transcriptional regulator [Candidatus Woesearchaeota archaeon]|nr:MerR family transcriptional regulator [Candidatus Woesearchaeota archaeon]
MTVVEEEEPTFGINTASRMTGIPVDTLRVWERRYDAVMPRRTADNKRRYTATDIARLRLFKNLVELGHSIGTVARLPLDALNERLQVHADLQMPPGNPGGETERPTRVLVYGDELPYLVDTWTEALTRLDILGTYTIYADFEREASLQRPEVLVVQFPSLLGDIESKCRALMQKSGAALTVVVYTYAPGRVLERINQQGMIALRTPVTPDSLEQVCRLPVSLDRSVIGQIMAIPDDAPIPPRRFTPENLATVVSLADRVRCECPQHLADLIQRLGSFEAYSADCENQNMEDALLHAHLNQMAGRARSLVEEALERWLQHESIALNPDTETRSSTESG